MLSESPHIAGYLGFVRFAVYHLLVVLQGNFQEYLDLNLAFF